MLHTYTQKDIILHAENISVVYGDKTIIKDINFQERDTVRPDVIQGQTICFLGRSGRGKSTLFKVLTGLINPTTGRVLIPDDSKPAHDEHQPAKIVREGDVGFVDQQYTLFRHKTVYQALLYAMRNTKGSEAEKKEKIMVYLEEWGLTAVKDQYPNELSGGQRQRTAILEQVLSSCVYMVLDEPFSGLDVGNIVSVKHALNLISQSNEFNTIIFSTHDIELAVELADSIYVLGFEDKKSTDKYGTILKNYDLKKMGLAWQNEITADHLEVVKDIKEILLNS